MQITSLRIAAGICLLAAATPLRAQDPGWPRKISKPAGTILYYQPQIDSWVDHKTLTFRSAFTLTPTGGKPVVGAIVMEASTIVDNDAHLVGVFDLKVLNTYFPKGNPATSAQVDQLVRTFVPPRVTISLERVVACLPKPASVPPIALKNDPPFIFVSHTPAILLGIDGEPALSDVPKTSLKFVVNTSWPLFFEPDKSAYFLVVGNRWLTAGDLHGPWSVASKLPKDMDKLPQDPQWSALKSAIPLKAGSGPIPQVFYSTVPAEVILFDGEPRYTPIPPTQLSFANNTDSPVFFYAPANQYFYLAAGRWFSSNSLDGPWTFASMNLPTDFAIIPPNSPAGAILASVPGTDEAKDAVLIAQVPTVMTIDPTAAAAQAKVAYTGAPKFTPIDGTSMSYATNTPDKVIHVGSLYYLCLQGIWFTSPTAQGPWTTANAVPQVIYTIPPSSPVYNVTYVTQVVTASGGYQSSYTAGYMGAFVMGAAVGAFVASGTGYYYPPYIGYPAYGYPVYHPYPCAHGATGYYHTATGAYGVSQTAYGAYGGSATRTASYNPYTGTATRTASASNAYGSQMVGKAYNPYTGTYGATHQGSSPTAQWGQSAVTNGNKTTTAQHYSTSQGTVASAQNSYGGKAAGTSTAFGSSGAAKTANGDMYASHDGNVYKNTGSGWQQPNGSGGWDSVNKPSSEQYSNAQKSAQSAEQSHSGSSFSSQMNQEAQNRDRGESQSQRFQGGERSSGGWGGGGRSWGGGGGGGFGGRRR
jgi:uncharacterized membrane protein YgcG